MAVTVFLFRGSLAAAAAQFLIQSDALQKADAIVVLGGDEFGTRIIKAAQLQQAGYAPYVLVSGPPYLLGHECDMTIEFARRRGYPLSIFTPLPHQQNSTRSETKFIGSYLQAHGARRIILVTSNYHTRRAGLLMRQINPSLQVSVVPAPDPFFSPQTWWKTRTGEKTFAYEWLKTVATALGY